MAVPAAIAAAPALRRSRFGSAALAAFVCLLGLGFLILIGVLGALFGLRSPFPQGFRPSQVARADIPPAYLRLYVEAGDRYGIDPWILAGIGSIETDHGRASAPGVHSGVNAFGCCAGPMQFSLVGSPSTWDRYRVDGDEDGRASPYDPADAIAGAASYLRAAGAPADYHAALFAYNHADWYVAEVLAKADEYRAAAVGTGGTLPEATATAGDVVQNPRIELTPIQRGD